MRNAVMQPPIRHMRLPVSAALALLVLGGAPRPALTQAISGDDLAAVTLGADDLPGFALLGDASPPAIPGSVREQHTRVFIADGGETTLTLILSAPHPDAVCLPRLRAAVADGEVLRALNGEQPGYQDLAALGAGDVDWAASWSGQNAGDGSWYTVSEDVFMRGELVTYVQATSFGTPPDAGTLAGWARLQDEKLLGASADPASPAGALALAQPPASPDDDPQACS